MVVGPGRLVVLACKVIEEELRPLLAPNVEFRSVEQGLHRHPEKLQESLQQEIDSIDADEILLGYGLCGKGVVGLRSTVARLVVPRVDDCISLLLGSLDRYHEEFEKEPGTYWLSNGWIEHASDPYKEYQRCLEKYDEETARWVAHEMMKSYKRLALIHTGVGDVDGLRVYAREFATFFNLEYLEMDGSDSLLKAMLSAADRNGQFIVVEPGEAITQEMFQEAAGTING